MPRILIKGGTWKNTEDEILKVSVMKYGKNQWSRIASLLHKKTAKQCKTRWYEWLDPGIKKTEWSRDEDEKLLHLAKLMPTQWRTIAPIVGRTASQCLERYEYLLDKAQETTNEGIGENVASVNDPRRLKAGEIDPSPETKPAKPDAVDMDEDELEMLSEARARLANTQGKKAKRKARERQLDEARRLSSMQKRRELLAAGIEGFRTPGRRRLRTFINYAKEVPFERKAPKGFFDTNEDHFDRNDPDFLAFQQALRNDSRDKNEFLNRKKDKEKQKRRLESDPEGALMQTHKSQSNVDAIFGKRAKLELPEPQVNDDELEQVVKMGVETQNSRAAVSATTSARFDTNDLLADYTTTPSRALEPGATPGQQVPLRTPTTVSRETNILNEARNIIALNNVQTPLKGGQNTALDVGRIDFSGVTPQTAQIKTPNTVLRQTGTLVASGRGPTPMASIRDNMGINSERTDSIDTADTTSTRSNNFDRSIKTQKKLDNLHLRNLLGQLPRPEDDFEIVLPTEDSLKVATAHFKKHSSASIANDDTPSVFSVHDTGDKEVEKQLKQNAERDRHLSTLGTIIQRELPHPLVIVNCDKIAVDRVEKLIIQEMTHMIQNVLTTDDLGLIANSSLKPLSLTAKKFKNQKRHFPKTFPFYDESIVPMEYLEKAHELIQDETRSLTDSLPEDDFAQFDARITQLNNSVFISQCGGTWSSSGSDSLKDLKCEMNYLKDHVMTCYSQRIAKSSTKLQILVNGYQRNAEKFSSTFATLAKECENSSLKLGVFNESLNTETAAMERRLSSWNERLSCQKDIQRQLQKRYIEITSG